MTGYPKSEVLMETKFLQLKQAPAPNNHPWYYAHRQNVKGVVMIIPVIEDEIILLETRRPPIYAEGKAQTCIELPAGLVGDIDKNETFIEAAKKELLEETGYIADEIIFCAENCASSPGTTSETFTMAIAKIKDKTLHSEHLTTDGGIIVTRHNIKISEVRNWLKEQEKQGKSVTVQTYAGLFLLLEYLD